MKKEEMIATMNDRFNSLTEESVKKFYDFVMLFKVKEIHLESTSPERRAELKAIEEQKEAEERAKEEAEKKAKEEYEAFLKENSEVNEINKNQLLELIDTLSPSQILFILTFLRRILGK